MEKSHIHLCYCQIPEDKLKEIARLRFVEGISTEDLMERMETDKEKSYVATVALLDVPVNELPKLVPQGEPMLLKHLLDCRDHVKHVLKENGIEIKEEES